MSIEEAVRARDTGAEPLFSLLKAWRAAPGAELGALIRILGAQSARDRGPIPGTTRDARVAAWHRIAAHDDPVDTSRLVEALFSVDRGRAEPLLAALAGRLPDPRAADALCDGLARRPHGFTSEASLGFWSDVLALLETSGDRRTLADLDRAREVYDRPASALDLWMLRAIPDAQSAIRTRIAGVSDDDRIRTWLADETRGRPDVEGAMEAVLREPADRAARAVAGDVLQLAGDVRGEFIALQCLEHPTPQQRTRMSELQRAHATQWLGPLAPLVVPGALRFRQGWPSEAALRFDKRADTWIGLREWRTFERLDLTRWDDATRLFAAGDYPVLRELIGVGLEVLANPGLSALKRVREGPRSQPVGRSLREAVVRPEELFLAQAPRFRAAPTTLDFSSPLFVSLKRLVVSDAREDWLAHALEVPGEFVLQIEPAARRPWRYRFAADRRRVTVRFGWVGRAWEPHAPRLAAEVPAGVERVVLAGLDVDAEAHERLRTLFAPRSMVVDIA